MADPRADLLRALREREPAARRRMLIGISVNPPAELHSEVISEIVAALHDHGDVSVRTSALELLTAVGDAALPALSRLLDDPSVSVRRLAVDAVGVHPTPSALPVLERAANDVDVTVRSAALEGISRIGGPQAVALLEQQLEPGAPTSAVLASLLGLEHLDIAPDLNRVRPWLADPLTAAAALRLLGRAGDLGALVSALGGASRVRARAALLGLQDGLEKGAPTPEGLAEQLPSIVRHIGLGDAAVAAAGAIVLAHLGKVDGVVAALQRDDATSLLTGLHQAVKVMERHHQFSVEALRKALTIEGPAAEVAREVLDAAVRRLSFNATLPPEDTDLGLKTYEAIAAWFADTAGLQFGSDARARVEARLMPRLEARGIPSFEAYLTVLRSDDRREALAAIEAVTIHETYFFREPTSLDALRDEIAPTLARDTRRLNVWSAGCSTGEEAYTLSMILLDLQEQGILDAYKVLGTDISPRSIARAEAAAYGRRSFRGELSAQEAQHLILREDGSGTPKPNVRVPVSFQVLNLLDDAGMSPAAIFDVIFCRNVLIYLTPEARRQVLQSFHRRLRPGGILVLGHSESLLHVENPFELWPLRRGLAYRRSRQ